MLCHQIFSKLLKKQKKLSAQDRALVAHCLISSLEINQDNNVDQAWAELAEKRFKELTTSRVKAVSWEDIKNTVKG